MGPEMAVVRITQGRDDEELLPHLPIIRKISAVILQIGFIDIAGDDLLFGSDGSLGLGNVYILVSCRGFCFGT